VGVVRELQERAARALPAERVEDADGWLLRLAPSCSWWVGAALPHADGDLDRRIDRAEAFYADHGVPARFQITPGVCPDALDAVLAERGYRRHSEVSLRTAATAGVLAQEPALLVRVDDRPADAWFAVWHAVQGGDARAESAMLDRVEGPSAYACALIGADVVAVGRAVADSGWAGVFSMATLPSARGRGAARAVLAALSGWADGLGAVGIYLQVERDNAAALPLYERAGFLELCAYHYRVAGPR
jgi:N-acetylglutamate synthase